MLTRLRVKGFKSLVDVDVRFGPFTCVAGPNGVGKSNLFDAITFLSALADKNLVEAASLVRADERMSSDVRGIFHHVGKDYGEQIEFEVEMLVPTQGHDDLGQEAHASATFLEYALTLGRSAAGGPRSSALEIRKEELKHVKISDAKRHLLFDHRPGWRRSVVTGRRASPLISTKADTHAMTIQLHQDKGTGGRMQQLAAGTLPRTVLSSTNARESPTALLAKREMESWRRLQLEPTALRAPDPFNAPDRVGANGAHIPATLARLAKINRLGGTSLLVPNSVYARVANRLAELVEGVRSVRVDVDERRELLSVIVSDGNGTEHAARALSDGTLRFLALSVIENDPEAVGLLCLEEPENGIHPARIRPMLDLVRGLAVDADEETGPDNPLRQVIINTHSPTVVQAVPEDSLLVCSLDPAVEGGRRSSATSFRWLAGTWRARGRPERVAAKGDLLGYLNPLGVGAAEGWEDHSRQVQGGPKRVIERADIQMMLPLSQTIHES